MSQTTSDTIRPLLARDPHYPRYHFRPAANWLNDPNGLIQWEGVYHLFYQYNPNGPFHRTIHWGHAASRDLVHWEDLPIALTPTPGGPDAGGCWSGCAVNDNGVPTLIYTGVHPQVQCLAVSHDGLRSWEKLPEPVIPAPPADLDLDGFRDPYVWREGDRWLCVIGTGIKGAGGAVLLYESADLRHWTYQGPICVGDPAVNGRIWECPNLFPIGDRWLLLLSPIPLRRSIYLLGSFEDGTFRPGSQTDFDAGGCLYAPQAMRDETGRRLVWGWLWEGRSAEACQRAGWNGVMSLPRQLDLNADGTLRVFPVPELAALRGTHRREIRTDLAGTTPIDGLTGDALELIAEFDVGNRGQAGLAVRRAPDGEEETRVVYDAATRRLSIDRTRSSVDPNVERDIRSAELAVSDGRLTLHLYLDRSVLEVFANERVT
ncbi:MAG TPA: glycoside hydrolase family 32 protein, partial [Chloroflexota bacterium]|nr:glycoside hydrolase family 32 protein [Chloroflexota bacterium]